MERIIKIRFAEDKVKKRLEQLRHGDESKRELYKYILQAISNIKSNPYCGIRIPHRLIPKKYITEYHIQNLFKYDLPSGWRLLYSVTTTDLEIVAVLLEYLDHKDYEKRFHYMF
jgi:hypothetical protein